MATGGRLSVLRSSATLLFWHRRNEVEASFVLVGQRKKSEKGVASKIGYIAPISLAAFSAAFDLFPCGGSLCIGGE